MSLCVLLAGVLLVGANWHVDATPLLGVSFQLPSLGLLGRNNGRYIRPGQDSYQEMLEKLNVQVNSRGGETEEESTVEETVVLDTYQCPNDGILARQLSSVELQQVNLTGCGITMIERDSFRDTPNVKSIDLSNNAISHLRTGVIHRLQVLTHLNLTGNALTEIRSDMFTQVPNVRNINLSYNKITRIASDSFQHMPQVQVILLNDNRLTSLSASVFNGLARLMRITLQYNQLQEIGSCTFCEIPKLEDIRLAHNHLTRLSSDVFGGEMQKMKILVVDHNQLTYLEDGFVEMFPNLQKISLDANPWQCSCLNLLFSWIYRNNVSYFKHPNFYQGKRPICVVGDSDDCDTSAENSKYYQMKYKSALQRY